MEDRIIKNVIVLWYEQAKKDYDNLILFSENLRLGVYYNYLAAKAAYEELMEEISNKITRLENYGQED